MEKQEILEKSRRENQKGDERERTIRMEGSPSACSSCF
ncbi:MAG: DUF6442 family protein [Dysosmobacter welbionis]